MKLLSLDIWDTVLRRVCRPDDTKRATARYLFLRAESRFQAEARDFEKLFAMRVACERAIGEQAQREGFDDEYEIHDVFRMWVGAALGQADEALVQELYAYELEQEKACSYIDAEIVAEIQSRPYDRLCFISDFYAGFIREILAYHGFPLTFDAGYISCEYRVNKRSGRLFDVVREREKPDEWTHIGDNPYSDVRRPRQRRIDAVLYDRTAPVVPTMQEALSGLPGAGREEALGIRLGLFFYTFLADILERCVRSGVDRVYYFTREGEFFKQIHDLICVNNPYGVPLPKAELLEVSRKSTFAASLPGVDAESMMRVWNQYSVQSMSAMFQTLDMDETAFLPLLDKYGIAAAEEIVYPWQDERVRRMFADPAFRSRTQKRIQEKRALLKAYLHGKGVDAASRFAIVDIGWRGTIQDNLCVLMPEAQIDGYYIALLPFLNPQPPNASKRGFLNDSPLYAEAMQYITPFEMICNSPNGSALSYETTAAGVAAIRKSDEGEDRVFFAFTQKFQAGVLRAIPEICRYCGTHAELSFDRYEQAVKDLHRFFSDPDRTAVNAFFTLRHNEEFGVGRFLDKRTRFRPFLFAAAVFRRKKRNELIDFLNETGWAQGYLKKYRLLPCVKLYRFLKRRG